MPAAIGMLSMMTLASCLPFSGITYTLLATNSVLTKMLPFSPWRRPRASSTPEAQISTLKPGGSLNFLIGSWSAGVGTGNAGTGAIFMASSVFGRPLAQPGSSSGFCCASAPPAAHSAASAISDTARMVRGTVCLLPGWVMCGTAPRSLLRAARP